MVSRGVAVLVIRAVGKSENTGGRSQVRALPDITSGPEVWQIFKIQTVLKLDDFLPGHWTFNTLVGKMFKI